jgi:hypothetical protein
MLPEKTKIIAKLLPKLFAIGSLPPARIYDTTILPGGQVSESKSKPEHNNLILRRFVAGFVGLLVWYLVNL